MKNKPFLADEGQAIKSACDNAQISMLFKCYRHLIEKFGSSGFIGNLVSKLLFIPNKDEFNEFWDRIL